MCLFLPHSSMNQIGSVPSLSRGLFFAARWTAARQLSQSITSSWSLLRLMPRELVNRLILCHPLLLPSIFPRIRVFSNESVLPISWPNIGVSASASVLPMNIQDWFPLGWTDWSPCRSSDSQGSRFLYYLLFVWVFDSCTESRRVAKWESTLQRVYVAFIQHCFFLPSILPTPLLSQDMSEPIRYEMGGRGGRITFSSASSVLRMLRPLPVEQVVKSLSYFIKTSLGQVSVGNTGLVKCFLYREALRALLLLMSVFVQVPQTCLVFAGQASWGTHIRKSCSGSRAPETFTERRF